MTVIHMSVIIDFIDLAIFAARVIHDHDIVVLEVLTDEFIIERLWSICLAAHDIVVLVASCPLELLHRLAKAERKHPVDFRELLHLHVLKLPFKVLHSYGLLSRRHS